MGKGRIGKSSTKKAPSRGKSIVKRRQHSQPVAPTAKTLYKGTNGNPNRHIRVPFKSTDNILLVGEGDFSFTLSLIQTHHVRSVTATCFDSEETLREKYSNITTTIATISKLAPARSNGVVPENNEGDDFAGFSPNSSQEEADSNSNEPDVDPVHPDGRGECRILYGIDATKLSTSHKNALKSSTPFSKIIFNFPHVGGLSTDVNRQVRSNQQLLVGFFNSAKVLLARKQDRRDRSTDVEHLDTCATKGQIIVTLFEGEPYTLWNIRDLARHCGLQVVESFKFEWIPYPEYKHARTLGDIHNVKDRSTEGKKKGAWKGEERAARSYIIEVQDNGGPELTPTSKKKRRGTDSSDDED